MKYQSLVNCFSAPGCILSVEKAGKDGNGANGANGEIRIVCANRRFKKIIDSSDYYDGMLYHELLPWNARFEEYCYRAAVMNHPVHAYVDTKETGKWADEWFIPMESDREDVYYCFFAFEYTKERETERLTDVSLDTASKCIRACLLLMDSDNFKDGVQGVLKDTVAAAEAFCARIMLADNLNSRVINFCDAVDLKRLPVGKKKILNPGEVLPYEIVKTWGEMAGSTSWIIVRNADDMKMLAERNPIWAKSLRDHGISSILLMPLDRNRLEVFSGYFYVANFNTDRLFEIKELLEFVTIFLGITLRNHLLMEDLRRLGKRDSLTGVLNRNAMNSRVAEMVAEREASGGRSLGPYGVIIVDLNGLKLVNDTKGHEAGDRLLADAAKLILEFFNDDDVYRIGGDEFNIILRGISREDFDKVVERLRKAGDGSRGISFAVGSFWSRGWHRPAMVIRIADDRMYQHKTQFYENNPDFRRPFRAGIRRREK